MGRLQDRLESFYKHYDADKVKSLYKDMKKSLSIYNVFKDVPFKLEVRMKNGVFGVRFTAENALSMNVMIITGYYFDNYEREHDYVWTTKKNNIKKFFNTGITDYMSRAGKITLNISEDEKENLIKILIDKKNPKEVDMIKMLSDNINKLEKTTWKEYLESVEVEYDKIVDEKHVDEVISMDLPMDWENVFSTDDRAKGVHMDSPSDALIVSLNTLGKVDIEYISQVTGYSYKDVICALKGAIFQNPEKWEECFYKGWETSDEYLSGNVLRKLRIAKELNVRFKGYFNQNIKALSKVCPPILSTDNVYVTIGSPWVPADIFDDFMLHLFGDWTKKWAIQNTKVYAIMHDELTGVWEIPFKSRYFWSVANDVTFGTKRITGVEILEKTLNCKNIQIFDEIDSDITKSKKKRVLNQTETMLAIEKQKRIIEEFQDWVWKNPTRKKRLLDIYESKFSSYVIRTYDGSFLELPNLNPDITLFPHQRDAIARILLSGNTLLSHDVGAGKTYVMICAGMEMKRVGISNKNMYVVPNNLVSQWEKMFLELYKDAKLLVVNPNTFAKAKRESVLKQIKEEEYDAIIIAYSSFDMIEVSRSYHIEKLKEEIEAYKRAIKKNRITSLIKKKEKLEKELEKLESLPDEEDYSFDTLGINTIFLDEAHNYKNVPIDTNITRVLGLSTTGSKKCAQMLNKVRTVQKQNNGRGVVFATGTPVTNSLTDIFVMQKYLQNGELELLDLHNFDSWIGMFAELEQNFEIDVDTNSYRMATRFSKFHNMPELANILSLVTDFHQVDITNGIPENEGYHDIVVPKTKAFNKYLKEISDRADKVRKGKIKRKEDNMLKITTDGRKAALDLRLVDVENYKVEDMKVSYCAENIYNIYKKTDNKDLTQLVFCDTSTPKSDFNLYDELRRLLVRKGIPNDEIAYIHDATTESQRLKLFQKVQQGIIRILIGSTFKLGLGVNVQNKLYALHHLDIPWRPADMVQREGRILRKGNENEKIEIYRYITDGSFDAYSWQLLESKQKMISSVLSGCVTERACEEIDGVVLDYAEVKAIAIGNPLLKERFEKMNELTRLATLQRKSIKAREALEIELLELPNKINKLSDDIRNCENDIEHYHMNKKEYDKEERKDIRELIHNEVYNSDPLINEKVILNYNGFDIIVPTNLSPNKPYLYIEKFGRYTVDLGQTVLGDLVRIDNFFDDLENYLENLQTDLKGLYRREKDIKSTLKNTESYADEIEELKKEIKILDEKLGVDKK